MGRTDTSIPQQTVEPAVAAIGMNLEVVVIPVSDVNRAKEFYAGLRMAAGSRLPIRQWTTGRPVPPPGSGCSVHFGTNEGATRNDGFASSAVPGSGKGYLIVSDIVAARNALSARGVEVSEFFRLGGDAVSAGLDPERRTYGCPGLVPGS